MKKTYGQTSNAMDKMCCPPWSTTHLQCIGDEHELRPQDKLEDIQRFTSPQHMLRNGLQETWDPAARGHPQPQPQSSRAGERVWKGGAAKRLHEHTEVRRWGSAAHRNPPSASSYPAPLHFEGARNRGGGWGGYPSPGGWHSAHSRARRGGGGGGDKKGVRLPLVLSG